MPHRNVMNATTTMDTNSKRRRNSLTTDSQQLPATTITTTATITTKTATSSTSTSISRSNVTVSSLSRTHHHHYHPLGLRCCSAWIRTTRSNNKRRQLMGAILLLLLLLFFLFVSGIGFRVQQQQQQQQWPFHNNNNHHQISNNSVKKKNKQQILNNNKNGPMLRNERAHRQQQPQQQQQHVQLQQKQPPPPQPQPTATTAPAGSAPQQFTPTTTTTTFATTVSKLTFPKATTRASLPSSSTTTTTTKTTTTIITTGTIPTMKTATKKESPMSKPISIEKLATKPTASTVVGLALSKSTTTSTITTIMPDTSSQQKQPKPPPPPPQTAPKHKIPSQQQQQHEQQQQQQHVRETHPKRYYHTAVTADQVSILYSSTTEPSSSSSSSSSSSLSLLSAASSRSHAIVYLVQKKHSTYQGRDSFGLLLQSLDLLFSNYFHQQSSDRDDNDYGNDGSNDDDDTYNQKWNTTDIYLFHTGDFTRDDLQFLEDRYYYNYNDDDDHNKTNSYHATANNNNSSSTSGHHRLWQSRRRRRHSTMTATSLFRLADLSRSKYWQVPKSLRRENRSSWFRYPQFSIGYRHMCAWFAMGIWEFFDKLNHAVGGGTNDDVNDKDNVAAATAAAHHHHRPYPLFNYTYLWRLDEDSFLLSPIRYDVFQYMQQHGHVYGYRLCSYELDYNYYMKAWFDRWHARTRPHRTIVLDNAGMCAFYNNFFVAQIAWFRQAHVQEFFKLMRPKIYRMRYGDLLLHTMALYAYANANTHTGDGNGNGNGGGGGGDNDATNNKNGKSNDIHRFLDFTYQHVTYNSTSHCVLYGGIQAGYNDPHAKETLQQFYQQQEPIQEQLQQKEGDDNQKARICVEPLQRFWLNASDLSPTYQHLLLLPSSSSKTDSKEIVLLETIVVGRMEIPGKGILSG